MTSHHAPDDAAANKRLAIRIHAAVLVLLVLALLLVVAFGLPALGVLGIVATLIMFAVMLSFTAGN